MIRRAIVLAGLILTACRHEGPADRIHWVKDGDPERGRIALRKYGCGACHVIPGVKEAEGLVGPPLIRWSERPYIAGALLNQPDNLIAWILFPDSIEPGTAMPTMAITEPEARDMAAYLYTLGEPAALGPPHPFPIRWLTRLMPPHAQQAR